MPLFTSYAPLSSNSQTTNNLFCHSEQLRGILIEKGLKLQRDASTMLSMTSEDGSTINNQPTTKSVNPPNLCYLHSISIHEQRTTLTSQLTIEHFL